MWADALEILAEPANKGFHGLGTAEFREFLTARLGRKPPLELKLLSEGLRNVQRYRGGSSHYQNAGLTYEKEIEDLERMRNLILERGSRSIITQMFNLFPR
jgi:hypothetical protein